MKAKIKTTEK